MSKDKDLTIPCRALKTLLGMDLFLPEEEVIVMGPVKSRVAVLIVIVLQALEQGMGWSQEAAQPRLDEEFTKQERIWSGCA